MSSSGRPSRASFSNMICAANFRSSNALFELIWHEDGSISFRGNNGKFVGTKKSGHLYANCDSDGEENTRYFFYLVNRPVLVLKCDQGNNGKFVGTKKSGHLYVNCENTRYFFYLVNRPVLVLKCD